MMHSSPFFRLPTLLLAALVSTTHAEDAASDVGAIQLRTHSLSAPYLDSDVQARWWDFGGSTIVRADQYVRLTGTHPSQRGWLFSKVPLTATNWEVEVEFKIHGTGSLWGDGMAIWFTKDRAAPGPVFGNQDRFDGLGIFVDTYKNNRPGVVFPYVMAMSGDGNTNYDKDNDGKANELAPGCSARGLRNADFPTKMKITYFQDAELSVDLIYKKENEWTRCFEVKKARLPSITYLGFSAETGELSDHHEIIKVETKNLYSQTGQTTPSNIKGKGKGNDDYLPEDYLDDKYHTKRRKSGSWLWFFVKIFLFIAVLGGGYVGFTAYRAQRRDRF